MGEYQWSPNSAFWQAIHGERDTDRTNSAIKYLRDQSTSAAGAMTIAQMFIDRAEEAQRPFGEYEEWTAIIADLRSWFDLEDPHTQDQMDQANEIHLAASDALDKAERLLAP